MLGDLIERTATQVRLTSTHSGHIPAVHKVTSNLFNHATGRSYRTRCAQLLTAHAGAILTTRPVSCSRCNYTAAVAL